MLLFATSFLLLLNAVTLAQLTHGESHVGSLSNKNLIKQLVNNVVVDIITADQEESSFCRTKQDVVIRESYVRENYLVSFTLPLTDSDQISVQTRHRVLYIEATNPTINFNYEYVVALSNILNVRALTWTFKDGTLYVSVPYKRKFGEVADVTCSEDVSNEFIYVSENGKTTTTNDGATGDVTDANSVSKSATAASRLNGGAGTDATAVADASFKAIAATNTNAATSDNGSNSTSEARSVSKGSSYSGGAGSVAISASAAGALSEHNNGTRSTSGATGIANSYHMGGKKGIGASSSLTTSGSVSKGLNDIPLSSSTANTYAKSYNVGGEKGLGASSTLTTTGSISKGSDGISLSSSTSAAGTINVFGKKKSSTITTTTAINKDGSLFSVKVTPENVTKTIIDVNI